MAWTRAAGFPRSIDSRQVTKPQCDMYDILFLAVSAGRSAAPKPFNDDEHEAGGSPESYSVSSAPWSSVAGSAAVWLYSLAPGNIPQGAALQIIFRTFSLCADRLVR